MKLTPHPRSADSLRDLVASHIRTFSDVVGDSLERADEVVVFGSFARGVEGPTSDLDVLAIGDGKRLKTRSFDLVFVSSDTRAQRWWLGGELAGHVATYGIWIQGSPTWRDQVFVSDWSLRKKNLRIISMLSDIYVRRRLLSPQHTTRLLERAVLEVARYDLLKEGTFIPATDEVRAALLQNGFSVIDEAPRLLGQPPALMLHEILACHWTTPPRATIETMFGTPWEAKLARAQAWRESGMDSDATLPTGGDPR